MLVQLFLFFLLIGTVSFGGGYAMIPVIEQGVSARGWISTNEFTDIMAIAGMSPGPIATNSATLVGYQLAGVPGGIISSLAMTIPSLVIILLMAICFTKVNEYKLVKQSFYGLRPIVTSLIVYAAWKFAYSNHVIALNVNMEMISLLLICLVSLYFLWRWKAHPLFVLLGAGIAGIFVF